MSSLTKVKIPQLKAQEQDEEEISHFKSEKSFVRTSSASGKTSPTKCHPTAVHMAKDADVLGASSNEGGADGQQPARRVEFNVKHDDRIKIEIPIEEEELLGSVTTLSSPAVRASARVIQKMKLDLIRPPSPPPPEKKESSKDEAKAQKTPVQTKAPKVIWTNVERNHFFEAINELGKDFEAIAHYVNVKQRRKSPVDPTFKTKDHVRLLYYQTFHKLTKYLRFSDDIKKNAQELYALINYGEMRKKLVFINQKVCMKLKELVYQGSVTVRFKGKNIRIKTPSCKALRKLNQMEEWQEEIKLPSKVDVYLKPANAEAWAHVQGLAQNPRVKTVLPLQKRVLSLIKTMQTRWRTREARLCDQTMTIQTNPAPATSNASTSHTRNGHLHDLRPDAECAQSILEREPQISFAPPPNTVIHRPMVNLVEFLSSYSICLNSYEDRIGVAVRGETLSTERINTLKEIIRSQSKRQRHDSRCAVEQKSPDYKRMKSDPDLKIEPTVSVVADTSGDHGKDDSVTSNPFEMEGIAPIESSADESDCKDDVKPFAFNDSDVSTSSGFLSPPPPVTDPNAINVTVDSAAEMRPPEIIAPVVAPIVLDKAAIAAENRAKRKESKSQANKKRDNHRKENFRPLLDEEMIAKIMRGWSVADVGDLTIGDLYIMFGQNFQVNLEYSWIEPVLRKPKVEVVVAAEMPEAPLPAAAPPPKVIDPPVQVAAPAAPRNPLSNKLKQLLLLVNMAEKTKKKTNCTCGHFCDKGYKAKNKDDGLPRSYISNKIYPSSHNDNSVFRHPTMPGVGGRPGPTPMEAYRLTLTHSRNKQNRWIRARNMRTTKQVVVQRLLPLQPGATQSYDVIRSDTDYHPNGFGHQPQTLPSASSTVQPNRPSTVVTANSMDSKKVSVPVSSVATDAPKRGPSPKTSNKETEVGDISSKAPPVDATISEDTLGNDPGIQSLMDISLPSPAPTISNIDEIFSYSNCPMSPMTLLRQSPSDSRWFDDNVNDFSLSSFLGHLEAAQQNDNASVETPKKSLINHPDIDSSRLSALGDSVDYMSKFEEIAQSMLNREQANE